MTVAALGMPYDSCKYRELSTLSGGEQKRLALEALLRGPDEVLLLDEPDNYLDVPGKRWLEERLLETRKTVLFVSHDRELLARVADRVVTVEGGTAWVHGGGFASYHEARTARHERLAELRRRWDEEHQRLIDLVRTLQQQAANSPDMANRYHAMQTRLAKFEAAGPPPDRPPEQKVAMRLRGGRTGVRAVMAEQLELTGLMKPFDAEIWYGDRVGVLGANGAGKSHFLRLLAGPVGDAHRRVPARRARRPRVLRPDPRPPRVAGPHAGRPALARRARAAGRRPRPGDGGAAPVRARRLRASSRSGRMSGGQQARFQILLLELSGATLLLLDEPTDNLDVLSAEALEEALEAFDGTVLAVTHDRWFARSFDRFLVFGADGRVYESAEPVFDETRVQRAR